jgi:mono/diheme cytochrome c family protein
VSPAAASGNDYPELVQTENAMRSANQYSMTVAAALLSLTCVKPLAAASPEQGKRLAILYCAKCHATDKVSPSPLRIAPPFRTLHERYPVERLQEALSEGIVTGHPTMPEFSFDADQVGDFIAFLKTLE